MCKASIDHDAPDGQGGMGIILGTNEYGMGTVHDKGKAPGAGDKDGATAEFDADCLVCVHTGAEMRLTELTEAVITALECGPETGVTLIFVETPGHDRWIIHDLVVIQGRPDLGQMPLASFTGCSGVLETAPARGEISVEDAIGMAAAIVPVTDEDPVAMLMRIAGVTPRMPEKAPVTEERQTASA